MEPGLAARLRERFGVDPADLDPRAFYRITDNWLELTVPFMLGTRKIHRAMDSMSRHILAELDRAGIGITSATYDIVSFPAIEMRAPADPK